MTTIRAYLTIDDSPSAHMGQKIDFLLSKRIPAIFFCEGYKIEQHPDPVIHAIQNGFVIGNHSYSHSTFSSTSQKESFQEIENTDVLIDEIYQQANVERPAKFFRFPYGDKGGRIQDFNLKPNIAYSLYYFQRKLHNLRYKIRPFSAKPNRSKAIQQYLHELGYTQPVFENIPTEYRDDGFLNDVDWYWTFNCVEFAIYAAKKPPSLYNITGLEDIYAKINKWLSEKTVRQNCPISEEIILIHDHENSTELFFSIIEHMKEKGIQFTLPGEIKVQ